MKRGQITLFVIIAILLVSAIGVVVYTQREVFGIKLTSESPEIRPISSFVENCIKSTGEDALIFTGQQGGYFEPKTLSVENIPYYFYNNKSYLPSKQKIESEISFYMNEMLPFCTKNFVDFPDFYIEANPADVKTKTTIWKDRIRFEVQWPVIIKKGETTHQLNKFSSEINSRLNTIYLTAENFISLQLEDPSSICLSCLTRLAIENDLYIDMADYGNNTVVFTITDKKATIKDQPYEWSFANRY